MTPYAQREIILIMLVGGAVTVLVLLWWPLLALLPLAVTLALLSFYRDPVRAIPEERGVLLAPADGRVVAVSTEAKMPGLETPALRIMIFLAVYNVHINRSPCAGEVMEVEYRPGRFHSALSDAADEENESNRVVLQPTDDLPGPIHVRQVAGILARRIVCAVRPGDTLSAGQRYGMIKLGSRTEVLAAQGVRWQPCVQNGSRVRAGRTILARLRPEEAA